MDKRIIYVTGMFRSGTTLLGKCIGSHPQVAMALDPILEVFREVRNKVAPESIITNPDSPFGNNFWIETSWKKSLKSLDFKSLELDESDVKRIIEKTANRSKPYSPKFSNAIQDLNFHENNIKGLLSRLFKVIGDNYGEKGQTEYVGFKEVWGEDFAPALLNNYEEAKVVHIIRDPRAVVSSKLAQEEHYPYLFLARFWRKSAILSTYWTEVEKVFSNRYKVIFFEELVEKPAETLSSISDFLGLDFSEEMLNYSLPDSSSTYENGANSSYSDLNDRKGFSEEAIDKWVNNLDDRQQEFVEWLTYPEIQHKGYKEEEQELVPSVLNNPPKISSNKLADWLEPYEGNFVDSESIRRKEYSKEILRRMLYELYPDKNIFSDDLIEQTFYDRAYLDHLKKQLGRR